MSQWKQLSLFPLPKNSTSMSFEWWLQEVRDHLYTYTGIPLDVLFTGKPKHQIQVLNWVGGELNLQDLYKQRRQPLEAALDILELLIVFPFESPAHAQYLRVRDNRQDSIEDALSGEEYYQEIHGLTHENLVILDYDNLVGELEFPSQYQIEERQRKLDTISKAPGLKPFCNIDPKGLLTVGE